MLCSVVQFVCLDIVISILKMETILKSQEIQTALKARTTVKSSVTKISKRLKDSLILEPDQKYDFSKLNKKIIQDDYEKLQGSLQALEKAHDTYVEKVSTAAGGATITEASLEAFEDEQDKDFQQYRVKALDAMSLYEFEYTTALNQYLANIKEENKSSVSSLQSGDAKMDKDKSKTAAKKMINRWSGVMSEWSVLVTNIQKTTNETAGCSFEELEKMTILIDAEKKLQDVYSCWKSLMEFHTVLLDQLYEADYDDQQIADSTKFDMNEQIRIKGDIVNELERIFEFKKLKDFSTSAPTDSTGGEERSSLKLKGLTAPQFSGKAEDFASWKERFLALVPKGRSNEEVAALLELSIPAKKVYLLRECRQDDYNGMIDILQRELAPTRDVINNVKLQLSKLRKIEATDKDGDKKFITRLGKDGDKKFTTRLGKDFS